MTLFKNGRKPPYMESEEIDLNEEKIFYAVKNMSFSGLQNMACLGLLFMSKFLSPAEICRFIEDSEEKNGS